MPGLLPARCIGQLRIAHCRPSLNTSSRFGRDRASPRATRACCPGARGRVVDVDIVDPQRDVDPAGRAGIHAEYLFVAHTDILARGSRRIRGLRLGAAPLVDVGKPEAELKGLQTRPMPEPPTLDDQGAESGHEQYRGSGHEHRVPAEDQLDDRGAGPQQQRGCAIAQHQPTGA